MVSNYSDGWDWDSEASLSQNYFQTRKTSMRVTMEYGNLYTYLSLKFSLDERLLTNTNFEMHKPTWNAPERKRVTTLQFGHTCCSSYWISAMFVSCSVEWNTWRLTDVWQRFINLSTHFNRPSLFIDWYMCISIS